MFSVIFAIQVSDCYSEPWLCLYDEYKEILKESIEKMSGVNLKEMFKSPQIRSVDFTSALNKIKKLKNENEGKINEILEKCIAMCPPKDTFKVYFIPLPFDFIMSNHSPQIGTFILYGGSKEISYNSLKLYLPHEYAHVVRLQEILLPENKDSPYKMTLGELAIFEGLGVAFSMVFNHDLSEKNIARYIGLKSATQFDEMDALLSDFMKLKDKKISDLSKDIFQKYYGEESKALYIIGTHLILKLISEGYSICSLNKMKIQEIMELIKKISKNF